MAAQGIRRAADVSSGDGQPFANSPEWKAANAAASPLPQPVSAGEHVAHSQVMTVKPASLKSSGPIQESTDDRGRFVFS